MQLRPCQLAAADVVERFFRTAGSGGRMVLAAPTGSGKSLVELEVQKRMGGRCWIVTPRIEIARGLLEKLDASAQTQAELVQLCWEHRVVTPVRFRNALVRGELQSASHIVLDEGHHAPAGTWEEVQLLCGLPPACVFTATPYRGTARGTAKFLAEWGEPVWMVTLREAEKLGYVSFPKCVIEPLVDDDIVELNSSGEFDVSSAGAAYSSRLEALADLSMKWVCGLWDRPTAFAFPTTATSRDFASAMQRRGAGAFAVTASTPRAERDAAYAALVSRAAAVCQVGVLGEGVDLPIRRLVDAFPRMSPVAWMQQLGRCTRPSPEPPEYVCTNRNLIRHAYLLEGLLPATVVAAAQESFGGPGARSGARALGLECLGRFKGAEVKCVSGCTALLYCLFDATRLREFACFVHPGVPDPLWAERTHAVTPDGRKAYGRWKRCDPPADLRGFASFRPREPTDKMTAFWKRSAVGRGLDPEQRVTWKNFPALPLLLDIGMKVV